MNVLFLTHRLPYAPNRGDRVRAWHLLRTLRPCATVDLVSLVQEPGEADQTDRLRDLAASVRVARVGRIRPLLRSLAGLPTARPTTHSMLNSPQLPGTIRDALRVRRPDVVLAYCSGMARLALDPPLDRIPLVLDMVDVDSAKWSALSTVSRPPLSWIYRREARVLADFERRAATHAVTTMVVTPRERDTLRALAPSASITVVPNGVDVDGLRPPDAPVDSQTVVFCGVMNYGPNEQAAELLAREVWPLVRTRRPSARLQIVGAQPSRRVLGLAGPALGIDVTGAVPDVRPYLWSAAVAAAPLVTARGIQNKVLEAVAAGLPVVVTPNVFDSLPDAVRSACRPAAGAVAIAEVLLNLLALSPTDRRALASSARLDALRWEQQLAPVPALLQGAAAGVGVTRA